MTCEYDAIDVAGNVIKTKIDVNSVTKCKG